MNCEISMAELVEGLIHFTDGPLVGCDDAVKKYDRHKSSVMIRTEFLGAERKRQILGSLENVGDDSQRSQ